MGMVKSPPLVTIVTPVYNGEAFLAETMACVQTLDYPNLVHVVLDNNSSDTTPDIISRFENARVPVLRFRNETTLPMSDNWNKAVGLVPTDADYFWVLCADDTLSRDAITKTVAVAEAHPSVALVGSLWKAEHAVVGCELPCDRSVFESREILRGYLRRDHAALAGMNKLIRRNMIGDNRPFYDSGEFVISFDTEANLRACLRGNFGFVHEELFQWRSHVESTTVKLSRGMMLFEADWPLLLDRYGGYALGHREYLECRNRFRRYLLRNLLLACFKERNYKVLCWHLDLLRKRNDAAYPLDFIEAIVEWFYLRITGQRHLVGRPR